VSTSASTIIACATGPAAGALAVIRLSGERAQPIAESLLGGARLGAPRRMVLRHLCDSAGAIDRCLVVFFAGGASFTGEPVVEFHVHGGPGVVASALKACVAAGARLAEPGEFTRRAYQNGTLDLLEAEAIAARVAAQDERAARLAEGGASDRLRQLAQEAELQLTQLRAAAEGWLDFDPEELGQDELRELIEPLRSLGLRLAAAVAVGHRVLPLFEPPVVVLAGPTNAGKSSIFNCLAGADRAIVSSVPGTTRDILEVTLQLPQGAIRLRDSAGIRRGVDTVEAEGIRRTEAHIAEAQLVLWVQDPAAPSRLQAPDHSLILWSKADLGTEPPGAGLSLSVRNGTGVSELLEALGARLFVERTADPAGGVPLSRRQIELLDEVVGACARAQVALSEGAMELVATDLRGAAEQLAALTGTQQPDEAMLDALFARFCLGK
jgi:tRNA modification GTPase